MRLIDELVNNEEKFFKTLKKYPFECSDSGSYFYSSPNCDVYLRVWITGKITQVNENNVTRKIIKMMKSDGLIKD